MNKYQIKFLRFLSKKLTNWLEKINKTIKAYDIKEYEINSSTAIESIEVMKEEPYSLKVETDKNTGEIANLSVISEKV